MSKIWKLIVAVLVIIPKIFFSLFGKIDYNPPNWFVKLSGFFKKTILGKKLESFKAWKKENPKLFKKRLSLLIFFFLLMGFGGYLGLKYYNSLPKPDYATPSLTTPYPTYPDVGIPDKLYITFDKSVAKSEDLNKAIAKGVKIKPDIQGTWRWESDNQLSLQLNAATKTDWAVGQKYEISFEKSFFASHVRLKEYDLEFSTEPVKMKITKEEFYIDPNDPKIKKVLVNLSFNYPINAEDFKKRIKFDLKTEGIELLSKKMPFQVSFNKYFTEAYLQSEPFEIQKENQKMLVAIEKGAKAIAGGPGSADYQNIQVKIPGLYEAYKVESVTATFARNDKYEPEQIIVIKTTVQTKSEELAKKLKIFLLPKNYPAVGMNKEIANYRWQSAAEVTSDIRAKLSPLSFTLIPSSNYWSKIHTFKISAEAKRSLMVAVEKGIKGLGDFELRDSYESVNFLEEFPRELQIMSKGALLSLSGDLKIPLLARNVAKVEFQIYRVIPDQVNHILSQMGSSVENPYLDEMMKLQVSEKFETSVKLNLKSEAETQYFSLDIQPFLNKSSSQKGIFIVEAVAKNSPDDYNGPRDRRLIMVTDLGILVKETVARNNEIYIQNFKTGSPVESAQVEIIGRNGLSVLTGTTDHQGHVSFPDLKDFKNEKYPIAFSVKKGADQSFLPYKAYSRNLQYSRFDIGGLYEDSNSDQLMSMIFSDRGIYRPGETANLGLIVRPKAGRVKLQQIPLQWSVTNSRGQEILKEKIIVDSSDLKSLEFKTDETSPTGTYDIRVFVIKKENYPELIGSQTVRVEEFQPDKMKIRTTLSEEKMKGWIKPGIINAKIELKNLFGTAAEARRVKGSMVLSPVGTYFRDYKDYQFTNLNRIEDQVFTEQFEEVKTNEKGFVEISLDLKKYTAQLFNLRFDAEGFEGESGRSVFASTQVLVSPLEFLVGAKPDGDLNYIKKDTARNLDLIAINSDLAMISAEELSVQILERKYVSVLAQENDGSYKYQSVLKEYPGEDKPLKVASKGSKYKIDTSKPGDFTFIVKNKSGLALLKVNYSIIGEGNLTRSLEKNAELQLSLNKSDFKTDEEIELQIKAPYSGSGLISIERDGVYSVKWFKAQSATTVERIKIPQGLEGNAYVNVTFLRALDSKEIFTSPLSYAVAPFSISLDEKTTKINLQSPEKIKPGDKLQVKYSTNKKTDIILYGVDEGILQVARYKTPDPLKYFFQKRALQVQTYQMLDLLLPEFSIVKSSLSPGGDEGLGAIGKNLNPFKSKRAKPVVFWSGVISADTQEKTFTYEVPDYFNGNIKVMAIAASDLGLGSTETSSFVRGDFIITPSVPVFVAPQDEFKIGLSVANQLEKSGEKAKVSLQVSSSEHFKIISGDKKELEIPEGREVQSDVMVKVQDKLGEGNFNFKASLGAASGFAKMELSVRPASPFSTSLIGGLLEKTPMEFNQDRSLYTEFAKSQILVSTLPMVIGQGLLNYLETYPYGCTEQVLSKAVPALILRNHSELSLNIEKQREYFKTVIQALKSRQRPDGGFALYSPQYEVSSPMVSLFAIHYLIEARDKKLAVPEELLLQGQSYLVNFKNTQNDGSLSFHRKWAYSLYLLARLGVVNGASLGELKRALDNNFKGQSSDKLPWQQDTTALYLAGIYQLYKQEELGEKIISKFKLGILKNYEWEDYLDSTVKNSLVIYITAKHYPKYLANLLDATQMKILLEPISQGQYNTHSAAYLLLALDSLAQVAESNLALSEMKVSAQLKPGQWEEQKRSGKASPFWNLPTNHIKAKIEGPNTGTLFYAYYHAGFDNKNITTEIKQNIEVSKDYFNKEGNIASEFKIGDEVEVSVRIRSLDNSTHSHIALVDLIPGGFEIILDPIQPQAEGVDTNPPPADMEQQTEPYTDGDSGEGAFNFFISKAYAESKDSRTNLAALIPDFVDKREDRVIIYTSVTPEYREYKYKIKAVNEGSFVKPPAFAEGMYDRSKKFIGKSEMVKVTAP